jgi:hypothetical protein
MAGVALFFRRNRSFLRSEKLHDFWMAKFQQLRDLYRFPGFHPGLRIRGEFGDPMAVVISLRRRRKKRFAAFAGKLGSRITTNDLAWSATYPQATVAFISPSSFEGSFVFIAAV